MQHLHVSLMIIAAGLIGCGDSEDSATGGAGGGTTGSGGSGANGAAGAAAAGGSGGSGGGIQPPLACDDPTAVTGFFAAPEGSPSGDGSLESPWDIATALDEPAGVAPGDTIWLRGGIYPGTFVVKLDGTVASPITVRSYPGEWAVLDSAGASDVVVQVYRSATVLRDLEVTNSDPDRTVSRPSGVYLEGPSHSLVNLVIHDVGTGIITNSATTSSPELAPELTIYGSVLYNNGWTAADGGHGHHLYLQNRDGTKHIQESVLFNAFAFGFHLYSDSDTYFAEGYELRGNVAFQNGAATPGASKLYDNFMIGHNGTHPVRRLALAENYGWSKGPGERNARLGWSAANEDVALTDNYFVGDTIFQPSWTSVTMSGNTFYGAVTGVDTTAHPNNAYLPTEPAQNHVVVRPNAWQPGRAHVIVYNWEGLTSVSIDPSGVIAPGDVFELRHVMDLAAAPVAAGDWDGQPISVPMTDLPVAQPIGAAGAIEPSEMPGRAFAVFRLIGCTP